MTVAALPSVVSYVEDGTTVGFPVPYRFQSSGLIVERIRDGVATALAAGIDYTVTGGDTDQGGTLTRTVASDGAVLRIRRGTVLAQEMSYTTGDRFPATSHEEALDQQAMGLQDLHRDAGEGLARAIQLPIGETARDLPPAAARRDTVLTFDPITGDQMLRPIGSFPPGPPGGAGNVVKSIGQLRAELVSSGAMIAAYDGTGSTMTWTEGDFAALAAAYPADYVESDVVPAGMGAWVRQQAFSIHHRLPDAHAIPQHAGVFLSAMLFVSGFGVLPGLGDQTAALNRAILDIAMRGGGELVFDAAPGAYQVNGPVMLPSNVRLNLNGQNLNGKGAASYPDSMFVTGTLENGAVLSNIGSEPESKIVRYAGVRNGRITNAGRVFHLFNWVHGCRLENVATEDCRQVYRMERCFDCVVDQITARGSSSPLIPTYHHIDQANGMFVSRLNATTAWGMHLEGGTNAFILLNPVFEGGVIGLKITGDCLGLAVISPYFENIPGRAFDLRSAGAVVWTVSGMYASFVDIVLDDGGAEGTATIGGSWSESNGIFNIGASIGPNTFRAQMRVSGPRNYCTYNALTTAVGGIGTQPNWIVSPLTSLTYDDVIGGFSATDIRARARHHVGVIPSLRTGDVGDPVIDTIPYTTSFFPTGASVSVRIDTDIVWRPITQDVSYKLRIQEDEGIYKVRGKIEQDDVLPSAGSAAGKNVTASSYVKGGQSYLRLTVGPFNNSSGNGTRTGKVSINA